jgi:hypothetical protein
MKRVIGESIDDDVFEIPERFVSASIINSGTAELEIYETDVPSNSWKLPAGTPYTFDLERKGYKSYTIDASGTKAEITYRMK